MFLLVERGPGSEQGMPPVQSQGKASTEIKGRRKAKRKASREGIKGAEKEGREDEASNFCTRGGALGRVGKVTYSKTTEGLDCQKIRRRKKSKASRKYKPNDTKFESIRAQMSPNQGPEALLEGSNHNLSYQTVSKCDVLIVESSGSTRRIQRAQDH
ncbi:hypothetical protein M5K25_026721 [Dendrobium thyrsiflorum]|uniref:Uncharacterized protein n=1 Tax=Dendrobium thyrsiflorum TaxID=117978 RepID=A0ABD0TY44_DENTH